jgi:hypothetical protein
MAEKGYSWKKMCSHLHGWCTIEATTHGFIARVKPLHQNALVANISLAIKLLLWKRFQMH